MCLMGFLSELFCSAVEATDELEQVSSIKQVIQDVDKLKKIKSSTDNSDGNGHIERDQINRVGKEVATRAFGVAIQTNPSLNAINNTVGAVQDYRKGEDVSEIMKHRTKKMVEDQVPKVVLKKAEAELHKRKGAHKNDL